MAAKLPILRRPRGLLEPVVKLDCELFARVAGGHTPWLDRGLPLLSRSANHSGLWVAIAACLAAGGGRRGQRAAIRGLVSIGVTSLVVNQSIKRVVRRPRPSLRNVPAVRRGAAGARGAVDHVVSVWACRERGGVRDRGSDGVRAGRAAAGAARGRGRRLA